MKLFHIILVAALMVLVIPLEALCCDHHQTETHHSSEEAHHGVVSCHAACCGIVLTSLPRLTLPEEIVLFSPAPDFSYVEPYIPTRYRPPIPVS